MQPDAYPHEVKDIRLAETHISWVLLTGEYAYKIKKPVDMGFLDFSTLPLRHSACLDELRLNRRMAPELYLDVVPIAGPVEQARVLGDGKPIEYAVRMREFPQADQLDRLLDAGALHEDDMQRAAGHLVQSHAGAPLVPPDSAFGTPPTIRHPVDEIIATLRELLSDASLRPELEHLAEWCQDRFTELEATFAQRKRQGFVRECHGDLHLGNLVRLHGDVVAFDCIEFSAELRSIDVVSDIAFLMMDLLYCAQPRLAYCLINAYLEIGGDYDGVAVLRYYLVYRALVRAMVALLRRRQIDAQSAAARQAADDAAGHLRLAHDLSTPTRPVLFLMRGLSGSGKTFVSSRLMQRWPALRVRSDVERKRLLGLGANRSTHETVGARAYSEATTEATYERLHDIAATALRSGFSIIVDAANLQQRRRDPFRQLAVSLGAHFVILTCTAPEDELRRRLRQRSAQGNDPSEADEAVLNDQLQNAEPLHAQESDVAIEVGPQLASDMDALTATLSARFARRKDVPASSA